MSGKFVKRIASLTLAWTMILAGKAVNAQEIPEIPSQVSFGGITVNFDRNAQNIIEDDVKSLMSNKKFWEEKMDRAILHFPIVESILMDEEVPIDFKYLAVQESSFKPDVVSSSNAVGYWQFKPETAIGLNLRVDDDIDERKNISSSTHAAAWYLKKNNQQFNNWVSSLYSYYLGAGGVKKIIPANWAYAREVTLNGKTDRYMLRFFAHKIALEAGIEKHRTNNKIVLLESDYGKGRSFDQIAKDLDISSSELKSYNRWLNEDKIPTDREYLLLVPVPLDKVAAVRTKLSIPVEAITNNIAVNNTGFPVLKKSDVQSSEKNAPTFYEINGLPGIEARPGDKPKTLAKAGKLRAPKFFRYNDMLRDMPLIPGRVYYLARKNKKAATPFHTAQPGDTWQSVSQQYAIRLVNLLKYNRTISRNFPLQTGQVLWLTKKRPKNQPIEIAPPTPAEAPVNGVETPAEPIAKAATAAVNQIPDKPSGRKKYTPVLVEKSDSGVKEERVSESVAAAPVVTQPAVTEKPANTYKNSNDRVVIITQDGGDSSFKSTEENKPVVKKSEGAVYTASKPAPATPNTATQPVAKATTQVKETLPKPESTTEKVVKETTAAKSVPVVSTSNSFHSVEKGQTYFSISNMYNLSIKELLTLNDLTEKDKLSVGQKLRVQKPSAVAAKTEGETSSKNAQGPITHTVVAGETLFRISKNYEVDIDDVKKLNNMSGNNVILGQKLKIPQKN
jgi:membrane-bound lytic murein transglycosylase D